MLNRRTVLKGGLIAGCSAAAHPLMSKISFAALPGERRLVVIVLRGAMDGLDVFQPYGDPNLRNLRKGLSLGPGQAGRHGTATDLDGFFALHPALARLLPMWRAGELAFAPAVSTPYRDKRSHFDGQDILEAGVEAAVPNGAHRSSGWLNRLLAHLPAERQETAYAIGTESPLILRGDLPVASWSPDQSFDLSPQAELLLDMVYRQDPLFGEAMHDARRLASEAAALRRPNGANSRHGKIGAFAASQLNGAARIVSFSITGWDSHAGQQSVLRRALLRLAETLIALREGLGRNWQNTTVLAMTEFGRTVRENGSAGTDHGTGGAMLMAGGAIRGGRAYGGWPGLGEGDLYADRDLMPLGDVRAYAGWAMHGLFGVPTGLIERDIFPGLDLAENPGFLA